ncbi:unnamed protein product [Didymodactylos carnosus]|uniref:Ig-like domain-containing protein n=1 Tax=Didymodactylos carnosus TaxID=1234261 RepID=A0A814WXL7_9BILA|nr:unnamed protein product [Didymodactylos carnosus]CAF3972339.1 unnamed protein product [Didymodactylos carnosus]
MAGAPRFSTPPAIRQTPNDSNLLFIECQVQASPKPEVTWFQNDKKLPATAKYKQVIKVSSTPNTFDISLEINQLGQTDAGTYRITVKNKTGEVSANVDLNFAAEDDAIQAQVEKQVLTFYDRNSAEGTSPTFIQKPIIKQENDGKRLVFECKIAADPKPDLSWSRDDVPIQDSGRYLIYCDPLPNNAYVACLEIDDVNSADAGKYKITAKNKLGESNAHISLNLDNQEQGGGGGGSRPTFTIAPQIRMFEESVLLECRCTAEPVPTFTWNLNGKPIVIGTKYKQGILSEGNNHTIFLEVLNHTKKDSGEYRVIAKNIKGDGSANIQLNIEGIDFKLPEGTAPTFITKPTIKQDAKSATVQIDIQSEPIPSIYWTKDSRELLNVDKIVTRIDRKGTNRYSIFLDIKNLTASDSGIYKCTLANELGTATANIVLKVVGDKISIEQSDKLAPSFEKPKVTIATAKKSITIECRCKGKQEPKITWKKDKVDIKETPNKYKMTKTKESDDTYVFALEILNSTVTDTGTYKIFAMNDAGESQTLINLNVDASAQPEVKNDQKSTTMKAPTFMDKPKDITANDGEKVQAQCKITGIPVPEITWFLNKKEVKPSTEFIQEYDGQIAKLTIPDGYVEDSGDWMCEAWNEAGEATENFKLTIKEKKGKEKRTRKQPSKSTKKDEEPSKKEQRKQVLEQQNTTQPLKQNEAVSSPTIIIPTIGDEDDEDDEYNELPTIPFIQRPRRAKPSDRAKRLSQTKLGAISELSGMLRKQ